MASQGAVPRRPRGPYGGRQDAWALVPPLNVPDGRGRMQKELPVTVVRHHSEVAVSAIRGGNAHTIVALAITKRA